MATLEAAEGANDGTTSPALATSPTLSGPQQANIAVGDLILYGSMQRSSAADAGAPTGYKIVRRHNASHRIAWAVRDTADGLVDGTENWAAIPQWDTTDRCSTFIAHFKPGSGKAFDVSGLIDAVDDATFTVEQQQGSTTSITTDSLTAPSACAAVASFYRELGVTWNDPQIAGATAAGVYKTSQGNCSSAYGASVIAAGSVNASGSYTGTAGTTRALLVIVPEVDAGGGFLDASATVTCVSTVAAAAERVVSASATVACVSAVAAAAERVLDVSAEAGSTSTVAAAAERVVAASATVTCVSTVAAALNATLVVSAAVTCVSAVTAAAEIAGPTNYLDASAEVGAVSTVAAAAAMTLAASVSCTASSTVEATAAAVLTVDAAVTAVSTVAAAAVYVLATGAAVAGVSSVVAVPTAVLAASATVTAAAAVAVSTTIFDTTVPDFGQAVAIDRKPWSVSAHTLKPYSAATRDRSLKPYSAATRDRSR